MSSPAAPEITVIVPCFNAEKHLAEALQSIKAQGIADCQVIVVDDGSRESPEPLVRAAFPGAEFIRQTNQGPSAARNAALRVARGRFVAFLDADDRWTDTTLPRLLKGFSDAPSADAVQGAVRRFWDAPEGGKQSGDPRSAAPAYFSFNVGAMLIRRQVFDRVGLFNEGLWQSEDVDFHIRMKENGVRKLVIPDTVLLYRRHAESISERQKPSILVAGHQQSWLGLLEASLQRRRQRGQPTAAAKQPSSADITVVLVVRNGRKFLPSALATIRGQTLQPTEILAIVGPSNDGTEDYLTQQPDVRVVPQSGAGLAAARNQAVKMARHEWIAFLDCDDLWHPAKLASQMEMLSLFDKPSFSVTSFVRVESAADDLAKVKRIAGDDVRIGLTPSALMVHRKVFGAVGEFDPGMGIGCDTDWFVRAHQAQVPCAVASQILLYKRIHEANLSHDARHNRERMFRIIEKNRMLRRSPPSNLGRDEA